MSTRPSSPTPHPTPQRPTSFEGQVIGGDPARAAGRLLGKRAIVTGAGSGIGRATALLFAAEGAQVLAADRSLEGLQATLVQAAALDLSRHGGRLITATADAAAEDEVRGLVARAVSELGGLDIIYANAGIGGGAVPITEQTVETWQEVLRVNLIGPFLAIKHAGAHMVAQGRGSIICTASVAALRSNAGGNPYSASKAGVVSLVQTSANAFWGTGVRVNAICPGLIETGMTRPVFERARQAGQGDRLGQINPLARYGLPQEIAAMALFLASDESSYVNGQAMAVDGGLTSTHPFKRRSP
jgi:NAD(P)-dependent dehydrogenase (short-subunit alcohol dehydrogenase family)